MAAVSVPSLPLDIEDQFVEHVWEAFKPYALMLRNMIMQDTQASEEPSAPSDGSSTIPLKLPPIQTRRAACTHLTMVLLYGKHECMICHRPSDLGWVYSCTQDDERCPLADSGRSMSGYSNEDVWLNPWVEKAIKEGHYTPKQTAILRAQKRNVNDSIAAAEEQFKKALNGDSMNPNQAPQSATSPSVDANPHLPFPVINEVEEVPPVNDSQAKLKVFPHCKFRSCHNCRPTFRDRAWQVLEQIFAFDFFTSMRYSSESRRGVSDVEIVRKIGLHKTRPTRPPLRRLDSIGLYSPTSSGNMVRTTSKTSKQSTAVMGFSTATDTVDISDAKTEPESRGFRDSVKRAFRGMLSSRRRDSSLSMNGSSSAHKGGFDDEDDGAVDFDMGLWHRLNDELLRDASVVPLPGHDGMDGLSHEEGEIEVKDGVAVTEEGVDLGTADIIMSI